jgi:hypothetical protein
MDPRGSSSRHHFLTLCLSIFLAGCSGTGEDRSPAPLSATDSTAAREVVLRFGERLQRVSLLAPDSLLRASIRSEYEPFVSAALLESWLARPTNAPGRLTSSPWPAAIEISGASAAPSDGMPQIVYVGNIVERTSSTPPGGSSGKTPVRITLVRGPEGWRIAQLVGAKREEGRPSAEPEPTTSDGSSPEEPTAEQAADVIREYYRAIAERRYRDAYFVWARQGQASRQTLAEFRRGFEHMASAEVDVGSPGGVEGAAGSRYVEIPVLVTTRRRDGSREAFAGTYTMRRSVVDGATRDQREWRIESAEIHRAPIRPVP